MRSTIHAAAVLLAGFAVGILLAATLAGHGSVAGGDAPTDHLAVPGQAGNAGPPLLAADATLSFKQLDGSLPGPVQVAIAPIGRGLGATFGGDAAAPDVGSMGVPVLVSLLADRAAQGLGSPERTAARAAIAYSDRRAISTLFAALARDQAGPLGAVQSIERMLRAGGDDQTVVATQPSRGAGSPVLGTSQWVPTESLKFFRALGRGCLLDAANTAYVRRLMRETVRRQRWGLGSAALSSTAVYVGGSGLDSLGRYVVSQSGLIGTGHAAVAVALVAHPPGSDPSVVATGRGMLTSAARWLGRELRSPPRAPVACPQAAPPR